jgi:hypothetical protein
MICGYSDYYDTSSTSEGVGYHCLMGAGNYGNDGKCPSPLSVYLKVKSGWVTPEEITGCSDKACSLKFANSPAIIVKKTAKEYYLIENRQKTGWGAYLPAQGLAVWHVDEAKDGNTEPQMTPSKHYECALVQADGLFHLEKDNNRGDSKDYFDSERPSLNASTTPNSKWWSGASSGISISNVSASGAEMTFTLNVKKRSAMASANDYNGDGKSDLLLKNSQGAVRMCLMNGAESSSASDISVDGIPVAAGDFNGDGESDILSRAADGLSYKVYFMSGGAVLSSETLLSNAGDWEAVGTGDFDGDGKTDILWQNNSTGQAAARLSGGPYYGWGTIYDGADKNWRAVGTGDLDGDGKDDIVWRNKATGAVIGYLMDGVSLKGWGVIYDGADKNWRVAAVGDLNGDGKADIVWENASTGTVIGYLMDGLTMKSWGVIRQGSGGGASLEIAGCGDYDGDGKADIALREDSSGDVIIYFMDGLTVSSQNRVCDYDDPEWSLVGYGEGLAAVLTMAVEGCGTVTPGAGAHSVPSDDPLKIKAVPAAGYKFAGWIVSGDAAADSERANETSLTLASDALVTAKFVPNTPFDFNGDGKSDLLWRNTSNGQAAMWLMSGALAQNAGIIFDSDATWVPKGKGDFNGDGKADIIWQRSTTGAVALWFMSGLAATGSGYLCDAAADSIIGVGDFNGDGCADILWRSSAGAVFIDLLQGATVISGAKIFEGGTTWIPVGTGDFNGDGKADILWRDSSSGNVAMWLMNGLTMSGGRIIFMGDGNWSPASCGDYDGDGKCDISWQSANGQAAVWLMSGFSTLSSGYIYTGGDSSWKIADSGDYDGDGKCDIVWRNSGTGQALIYFMSGAAVKGWTVIFNGDTNWTIVR